MSKTNSEARGPRAIPNPTRQAPAGSFFPGGAVTTFEDVKEANVVLYKTNDDPCVCIGHIPKDADPLKFALGTIEANTLVLDRGLAGSLATLLRLYSATGELIPEAAARDILPIFRTAVEAAIRRAIAQGADPGDLVHALMDLALTGLCAHGFDIPDQAKAMGHTLVAHRCSSSERGVFQK